MISRTLQAKRFSEKSITDWLASAASVPARSSVTLGIGDDCAIYRPRGSAEDLLFTSDLFIEDRHFRRETHTAKDMAHVALTRSLSDIAAMGGAPRFVLAAVCLPEWADRRWIGRFFRTLVSETLACGAVIAGGDLASGPKFSCDITVCGAVPRNRALRRDGAKPGDSIYVSGSLGGSALGLASSRGAAWTRHVRPRARLSLGQHLRRIGASSAIDISDGLSLDLQRLCLSSGVSADICAPPRFRGASVEQALHGGEEYELLFTAAARISMASSFEGLALTRIGTISKGEPGSVTLGGQPLPALGHDHFANR